jgi:PAS domain S-box-containing protein
MKKKTKTNNKINDLMDAKITNVAQSRLVTSSRSWLDAVDVMSKNVTTISPDETVISAAMKMSEDNISCVVVVDNTTVVGILTETDLLKWVAGKDTNFDKTKVAEIMSHPVVSIKPDLPVLEASKIAQTKQIKRLPVLDKNRLVGIITQTDLIRVLTSYGMWRDVVEIMKKDVVSIHAQASVTEAAMAMAACKISCIVVVGGGGVLGIFTEKDLLKKVVALQKDPAQTRIEEVMSSPVATIPPDYSVFSAAKAMEKKRIRRLVVLQDNKLCGIVTQTNIFMAIKDKLQKEEEENLNCLQRSNNNIYTVDPSWKTTYANPAFMELLEVSDPAELIGQPFLPEKFWFNPQQRKPFLRILEKGNVEIAEIILKTYNGRKLYVTIFCAFTKNTRGEINGRQGILHDNTERKQAAEALQIANEELKEQNRFQNEFIVTISHELRTPLSIFKNVVSNTLEQEADKIQPKLQKNLKIADETIDRLAGIINNFLDISEIETDKMVLNSKPLAIQSVVTDVLVKFKSTVDDKKIDLTASMPDAELLINADPERIIQVLSNLIDNAVTLVADYVGKIKVQVKDLGDEISITVEDNGPGIDADDISSIFDRFIQVTPDKQGTGLGLAICKELVTLHGGQIWAENIPTGGAKFCFTLPKSSQQSPLEPMEATTP